MAARTIPVEIDYYIRVWRIHSNAWLIGYFVIGIAGILLPATIASGLITSIIATKIVALAAAVISGLQSLLKCDTRANRYHMAWTKLNSARFAYEQTDHTSISEVLSAYSEGEMIIETAFTPVEEIKQKSSAGTQIENPPPA